MASDYIPAFADFFSTKNLEMLAWHGRSDVADHCSSLAAARGLLREPRPTLGGLAEALFRGLSKHCRVEYLFKSVALNRILYGRHSPNTVGFFFEMAVGESRADIVVVNGRGRVIEVKTDRDDLTRLPMQLGDYFKCFGEVALFVERSRAEHVTRLLPEEVGVVTMSSRQYMTWVRRPRETLERLEHEPLYRLLRRKEVDHLLESAGKSVPDVAPAERWDACLEVFETFSLPRACRLTHDMLKRRRDTRVRASASVGFPASMRAAVFGARMTAADWRALQARMDEAYTPSPPHRS
ncbi:MAG: sce7726 family protein [Nannocystaceae bacterium]|nr:sce7726 family protein [bacterium]